MKFIAWIIYGISLIARWVFISLGIAFVIYLLCEETKAFVGIILAIISLAGCGVLFMEALEWAKEKLGK